jgi:hypothetical protein
MRMLHFGPRLRRVNTGTNAPLSMGKAFSALEWIPCPMHALTNQRDELLVSLRYRWQHILPPLDMHDPVMSCRSCIRQHAVISLQDQQHMCHVMRQQADAALQGVMLTICPA